MEPETIETIAKVASIVLLVGTAFFEEKWRKAKNTAKNGVAVAEDKANRVILAAMKIIAAAEDKTVTPEEVQDIVLTIKPDLVVEE